MKLLATILIVLLSLVLSGQNYVKHNGQFVKVGGSFVKPQAAYVYQAETEAFWARISSPPSDAWKLAYDHLFIALKDEGILQKADVIKMYSTVNSSVAILDLTENEYNSVFVNGTPTFTAKDGFVADGSVAIVEMTPSTQAVNMVANNQTYYYRTKIVTSDATYVFGTYFDTPAAGYGIVGCTYTSAASSPWSVPYAYNRPSIEPANSALYFTTVDANDCSFAATVNGTDAYEYEYGTLTATLNGQNGVLSNSPIWALGMRQYDYADAGNIARFVYIGAALTTTQIQALDEIYDNWIDEISTL